MIRLRRLSRISVSLSALSPRLSPRLSALLLGLGVFMSVSAAANDTTARAAPVAIAIHGGAGTILREDMPPALEAEFRAVLDQALSAGHRILVAGGSSLDAVEAAVRVMEDSPLFNAGKGAVFTHEGRNELDAAIMDGATGKAGAVAGVTVVKNPISLARTVMEKSPHVLLIADGAERFAREQGAEIVAPDYFFTERRWQQLQKVKAQGGTTLSEDADKAGTRKAQPPATTSSAQGNKQAGADMSPNGEDTDRGPFSAREQKFGTVGAVARDRNGHLAAATSTGGMTNKRWGRVGDAPLIGAGTYANQYCAVSATGHGEYFIRAAVAHDICARVEYLRESAVTASDYVVRDKLVKMGGEGGVIAIDREGHVHLPFNSKGMYRASIDRDGKKLIAIYGD